LPIASIHGGEGCIYPSVATSTTCGIKIPTQERKAKSALDAETKKMRTAFSIPLILLKKKKKRVLRYPLSQFRDEYLVYAASVHTPKTYLCDEVALNQLLNFTGDMMLRDIGVREVERFIALKQKETSAWNAKKYYGHLASAFQRAVVWKKIDQNPFRSVKKPKPPEKLLPISPKNNLAYF
jgi:site-specific recombinase XerD